MSSLPNPKEQLAYLEAMGITAWVRRDRIQEDNIDVEIEVNAKQEELASLAPSNDKPAKTAKPGKPYTVSALPSFPRQAKGAYLFVCLQQEGDAFSGEAQQLMDKMVQATQWPAEECVFISQLSDVQALINDISPKIMILLGKKALSIVTPEGDFDDAVGKLSNTANISFIASYHPCAVLEDAALKRPLWEHLKIAIAHLA